MSLPLLAACAAALAVNPAVAKLPAPPAKVAAAAAPDPNVSHTYLGEVTGTVVKVGDGSITLSVPELVAAATNRRTPSHPSRNHRHAPISAPKATVKLVEVTYDLGESVSVKTVTGKAMTLADVAVGGAARVHVERLREFKPNEKADPHVVVKTIDIPVPAAAPAAKK